MTHADRSSIRKRATHRIPTRAWLLLVAATALGPAAGCGMRHTARTVGRGNAELHTSLGGPFIGNTGRARVPLPLAIPRVGGRYGATDWLDVAGSIEPVPLAFALAVFDVGAVAQLYRRPHGLAVSTSARLHVVSDLDDKFVTRVFPELSAHAEHPLNDRWVVFGGLVSLFQFRPPQGKPAAFAAPYAGAEVLFDREPDGYRQGLALQLAWISPWEDSTSAIPWEPAGRGAVALHAGWRMRLGGLGR